MKALVFYIPCYYTSLTDVTCFRTLRRSMPCGYSWRRPWRTCGPSSSLPYVTTRRPQRRGRRPSKNWRRKMRRAPRRLRCRWGNCNESRWEFISQSRREFTNLWENFPISVRISKFLGVNYTISVRTSQSRLVFPNFSLPLASIPVSRFEFANSLSL